MQQNRLYRDLSYLWPRISPREDHAEDALRWRQELRKRLGPGRHAILELGCGGGHTLSHLTDEFEAVAVDLSPAMLELSRRLNPGVAHHLGDMRYFRLGRQFNAVLIHDAVSYLLSPSDISSTIATARAHLKPGGVLIMNPDWFTETFPGTSVFHWIRGQGELELTFIEHLSDPDPEDTTIESVFLFILKEAGILRVEQDRHQTGLFSVSTWLELMEQGGFQSVRVVYPAYDEGYGGDLLVGVLRS